ncbi:MAG TPA: [FeFe] hydrogenase H-cluster radical SAM maturase HydG [Bacteroidales bacterium]|nr:[FeFe] hydrogenase H-cluster radical SAM maturase HydG [Bacteroidales bacterium]
MMFNPQKYAIPDRRMQPFIDPDEIRACLQNARPDARAVRDTIARSLSRERLSMQETALLLNAEDPELIEEIKEGARQLKREIYGNRIVLFAPLYIGNKCINDCVYCGFRASNREAVRKTLSDEEIVQEIASLEDQGQKRLILVYGEHPDYDAHYIAHTVKLAYGVKKGRGEIRRVNINAAPLDIEGFRVVKTAGIGTYQIFQETYDPQAYSLYHRGHKADYAYRLTALDRAQEAGIDDVGIGALFGLYDWKFEVLGLLRHTNHLEACYKVGPHTISFPRIKDASARQVDGRYFVSDSNFVRLVSILRLAVPYTGLILTAREPAALRDELIQFGVSQIDGGTKIEIGAYAEAQNRHKDLRRGQFLINDDRPLNDIIDELISMDMIPSFCTSCYRMGRTGEHFMEFSVPGFIKRYCTPNAILTLAEYLLDYAPEHTSRKGWELIEKELAGMDEGPVKKKLEQKLELLKSGQRDCYF